MNRKWWVLSAVACGTFMATLDSSIVNIALPTLMKSLNCDLYQIKWVVIIYLLVITCLLLPFGRLSDQYGRRVIFQIGFLIFILGSGLCSLSPHLGWLVAARAVQALGAAMLMANGPAIITAAFPTSERGGALGTLAMVVSAGLITGPSLGGILISELGWQSIFWVNIPVGLIGIYLVQKFVQAEGQHRAQVTFDWAGAFLQTILLISMIILFDPPAVSISGGAQFPISRWVLIITTVVIGAIFVKVESDARAPVLDLALFKIRTFWTANLASFLTFVSFSSVTVLMPFFLEEVMKFPTHRAGIFMTAIPLTILIVAPFSGRLSDHVGSRKLSSTGAFVGAVGLLTMAGVFGAGTGIDSNVSHATIVLGLCSIGLAIGLFQSPNNAAILSAVPLNKLGVASALLATVRNLGLVVGTGLATSIFSWRMKVSGDFVQSIHFTHFIAGFVSVLAMIASLGRGRFQHHEPIELRNPKVRRLY